MTLFTMRTLRDQKITFFVDHNEQSLIMYIKEIICVDTIMKYQH